jgi:apolipoprotein N-acyltransferase
VTQNPTHWFALTRIRLSLASFGLGAASALALPPSHSWWLLFVTVPGFLVLLESCESLKQSLLLGWLHGFGYFCVALHWIGFAFLIDAAHFLWMMPFAVGGLSAVMALYWAAAAAVSYIARKRGTPLWLAYPCMISVAEWLRGHLMTGFPWAAPGLAFDGMGDFLQLASIVGMPGLTLVILVWAGSLRGLSGSASRTQRCLALLLLMTVVPTWLWAHGRALNEVAPVANVRLLVVQPDIPQDDNWRSEHASAIFDDLVAQSKQQADATVIVWPESAVPFLLDESEDARDVLRRLLAPDKVLITGAIRRTRPDIGADYFTSIQVYDSDARLIGIYDKWRLVPGGEFLPLAWVLEPLGFKRLVNLPDGFSAGDGPHSLAIPGTGLAAALICYEAIFPDRLVALGLRPDWIVNVTNDGWFGTSTGPFQHFAQLRMRAVEQGLPAVRSANTGISGVIDPYGHVLAASPLASKAILSAPLPGNLAATPYSEWGDGIFAGLVCGLLMLTAVLSRKLR